MRFLETAPTAVVIPVHGGLSLTIRCLESLRQCDPLPVMVVVVDDGSPDATAAHLATHHPDVHVVRGDGNLWWAGAVNAGCSFAIERGASTLILLNNDDVLLSRNLPTELTRLVQTRGGCAGATLLKETAAERVIFAFGGVIDWGRGGTKLRDAGAAFQESDSVAECDWLPGMALAFAADTFAILGGIDSRAFPQHRADADFTMRARRRGYPCVVSPKCWVVNDRTQVSFAFDRRLGVVDLVRGLISRKSSYQLRSTVLFFLRHCPARWLVPGLASLYVRYLYAWLKTQRIARVESPRVVTEGTAAGQPVTGHGRTRSRVTLRRWTRPS